MTKALRTTKCGRHGHPEFHITLAPTVPVVEADAMWFLTWLEETVARGTRYEAGQICQVGWMLTQIRQTEDGDLSVWEPDMHHLPVEWSESVSHTLAHLRVQKDVVESVLPPEELSFPSLVQPAVVCTRLARSEDLVLDRTRPTGPDSGWFFGCRGDNHDHNDASELRVMSLYEAAIKHAPQIIPYLALPPGVLVGIQAGIPTIFRNGERLDFRPDSYLATRHGPQ